MLCFNCLIVEVDFQIKPIPADTYTYIEPSYLYTSPYILTTVDLVSFSYVSLIVRMNKCLQCPFLLCMH